MKNLSLIGEIIILFMAIYLSSCCKSDFHGDYLFDDLARQYLLDTTSTFTMIDNLGFKESFVDQSQSSAYSFYQGGDLDRCGVQFRMQMFYIDYFSTINRYSFSYSVDAPLDNEGPKVMINWNDDYYLDFYPQTGEIISGENYQAHIEQVDSMQVRGKIYHNILKIIFWNDKQTWTLYIARPEGLIKFIRPDGIYTERL